MFFVLSQLFSFLIMPFTLCLLLLASAYFIPNKKLGKRLGISGLILLLLLSNTYLSNLAMYSWEPAPRDMNSMAVHELGIILTGVTNLNKSSHDRTFFNKGADRATHAMQLYKMGKVKKLLITGGQGFNPRHDRSEARLLADFLIWAGVKEEDLILEEKAVNTRENALFTKDLIEEIGYDTNEKLLLITSAFHMKRAKGCFQKVGIETFSFPVDYYAEDPQINIKSILQPDVNAIMNWNKLVKEWLGILIYRIAGYL